MNTEKYPSIHDSMDVFMKFHLSKINENDDHLFMKSDSEAFRDSLWDRMKAIKTSSHNFFVEEADYDLSIFAEESNAKPVFKFDEVKPIVSTFKQQESECKPAENNEIIPQTISSTIINNQKEIDCKEVSNEIELKKLPETAINTPQSLLNGRKPTMDISDYEKSEYSSCQSEYTPSPHIRKRKKRRDVLFKTILRECRRYFQIQLSNLTGFITSKRPRNDNYMYTCMKRFNIEVLGKQGTFDENFYLACLLYPQDLSRNIDAFVKENQEKDFKLTLKEYKSIAQKIHDTLYKYSQDKLEFFVSRTDLSFLFCYFYENGAGAEKDDPKYVEEFEYIRNKCMDMLNRKF